MGFFPEANKNCTQLIKLPFVSTPNSIFISTKVQLFFSQNFSRKLQKHRSFIHNIDLIIANKQSIQF